MMKQQTPTENVLICRRIGAISKATADLKIACEIYNAAIERLRNADLLPNGVTPEIVNALIHGNSTAINAAIESETNSTHEKTRIMRRIAAQTLDSDKIIVAQILGDVAREINRKSFYCRLMPDERAEFVELKNGVVTFNTEKITEYYSEYASGDVLQFLEYARKVFEMLVEFDRKTRIFSRGKIRGVGDGSNPEMEIISFHAKRGIIRFDTAAVADLDNLGADVDSATMPIRNFEIVKPER